MQGIYRPGDYVCVDITSNHIGAWLADHAIKYFTKSEFCHAFIYAETDGTIIEARPHGGVSYDHISKYDGMLQVGSTTSLTNAERSKIVDKAWELKGRDAYGFLDILYLGMYTQGYSWNWLENKVLAETSRTICSQLVAMCGVAATVNEWLCNKPHPNLVTPANLANLAIS